MIAVNIVYAWRADVFLLPSGFEGRDYGYKAWLGLLQADRHYSNPHLLCFVELLLNARNDKNSMNAEEAAANAVDAESVIEDEPLLVLSPDGRAHSGLAAKRWNLAYTLTRNSGLIKHRRHQQQHFLLNNVQVGGRLADEDCELREVQDDAAVTELAHVLSVNAAGYEDADDDVPLLH